VPSVWPGVAAAAPRGRRPKALRMPLPAHLTKYDDLLDVLVDAIVRDIEASEQQGNSNSENAKAALPTKETRLSLKDLNGGEDTRAP
jgi:hypothetical protein